MWTYKKLSQAKSLKQNGLKKTTPENCQGSGNRKRYKAIKIDPKAMKWFVTVQRGQVATTMEEYLNYLHECNARRMTFKQAFSALGMVDKNKPLKQLNDEEILHCWSPCNPHSYCIIFLTVNQCLAHFRPEIFWPLFGHEQFGRFQARNILVTFWP